MNDLGLQCFAKAVAAGIYSLSYKITLLALSSDARPGKCIAFFFVTLAYRYDSLLVGVIWNHLFLLMIVLRGQILKSLLSKRFVSCRHINISPIYFTRKYFFYLFYKIICSHKQDHGFVLLSPIQFHLFTSIKGYIFKIFSFKYQFVL